jgi:hypothetical protein
MVAVSWSETVYNTYKYMRNTQSRRENEGGVADDTPARSTCGGTSPGVGRR